MSRDPAARYANLRGKVDKAMDNINIMKSASRQYNYSNATPLRQSNSPPNRDNRDIESVNDSFAAGRNRATAPMTETAGGRRMNRSPLRNTSSYEYYPVTAHKRTAAPPNPNADLLAEIDELQRERDYFAAEASAEKAKNLELEKEFMVLRALIAENSKPIGSEENMMLRNQY